MIKVVTRTADGRTVLMLGLSYGNLDKFRAEPLDTFITIDGDEIDIPINVMIFSGETEDDMVKFLKENGAVKIITDHRKGKHNA